MKRNAALLGLLVYAGVLAGCSSGSFDEEGNPRFPAKVVIQPDEAVVPQGSSIVVRVDIAGGDNEAVNGYEIELDEVQSRIDIRTAPCPANLERAACQDWTISPAADAVPGRYNVRLRSVGRSSGAAHGSFSLRVVQSPVAQYGAALDIVTEATDQTDVLMLTADGRIVSRGSNEFAEGGQGYRQQAFETDEPLNPLDPSLIPHATPNNIPAFVAVAPGSDLAAPPFFTSVSRGYYASYAVSNDGRVWHWGRRDDARGGESADISDHDFFLRLRPAPVAGPTAIRFVSTDYNSHEVLATDENGRVWAWGCETPARCSSAEGADSSPQLLDISGVRNAISTHAGGALFLMRDGRVLGSDRSTPVAGLPTTIDKLAVNRTTFEGHEDYVAIDAGGSVWTWDAGLSPRPPTRFAALSDATDVAVDFQSVLYALRRGSSSLWMWRLTDPSQAREIAAPPGHSFIKVAPGYAILNDCSPDGGSVWRIQPPRGAVSAPDIASYVVEVLSEFGVGGDCSAPADVAPLNVSVEGEGGGRLVSEPAGIDCTSSCTHNFRRGAFVLLNAVASPGWQLSSVSPEGCAPLFAGTDTDDYTSSVRRVVAGEVTECRAVFAESAASPEMRLTLQVTAGGSVHTTPAGISCGDASAKVCERWFPTDTEVTLEPTVMSGYRFVAFGGDPDCVDGRVKMDSGRLCQARFAALTGPLPTIDQTLTVRVRDGGGTVTGPGIDCPEDCTGEYPMNTVVTLEAIPDPGWRLVRWIDGCDDDPDNLCIVRVVGTQEVVVEFSPIVPQSTLRVAVNGSGIGTVTSSPSGIVCSAAVCEAEFDTGALVTLTATPAQGHFFVGWSGCDSPCTFALDASREVTATFEPRPSNGLFELSMAIEGPGRVLVGSLPLPSIDCNEEAQPTNCSAQFAVGSLIGIQAFPTLNWLGSGDAATFIGWSGDSECIALGTQPAGLVPMNRNVHCVARFRAPNLHLLRFTVTGGGTVTNDPPRNDFSGLHCREGLAGSPCQARLGMLGTVAVIARPDFGMLFAGWRGDCASYGAARNVSIVVADNMNCTAAFEQATTPQTLTVGYQRGSPTRVIESTPAGILCFDGAGSVCAADFAPGTVVTLRSSLGNTVWESCDAVNVVPMEGNICNMNMDQIDRFVLAVFPPL